MHYLALFRYFFQAIGSLIDYFHTAKLMDAGSERERLKQVAEAARARKIADEIDSRPLPANRDDTLRGLLPPSARAGLFLGSANPLPPGDGGMVPAPGETSPYSLYRPGEGP